MVKTEGEEMAGSVVQYGRFLEARERRQRIRAEVALTADRPGQLPTIDCETSSDQTGNSLRRVAAMVAPACSTEDPAR
jgi:hypothetical protein